MNQCLLDDNFSENSAASGERIGQADCAGHGPLAYPARHGIAINGTIAPRVTMRDTPPCTSTDVATQPEAAELFSRRPPPRSRIAVRRPKRIMAATAPTKMG